MSEDGLSDDVATPVPRVPDVAEPLLGFRSWAWDNTHKMLTLVVQSGTMWPPGQDQHAVCPHKNHPAADPGCTCGIYAATEIPAAAPYTGVGHCFGLVYGWGEHVVPAASGFRAEYARIAAIFAVVREVSLDLPHLRRIAQLYQVPLLAPHSLNVADYQLLLRDDGDDLDAELQQITWEPA
jgi:hypothetical protein